MKRHTIEVTGMSCSGCEKAVEAAIASIEGVDSVTADHEGGTASYRAVEGVDVEFVRSAIEEAGYAIPS